MAQSLSDRIRAVLQPGGRLADCRAVLAAAEQGLSDAKQKQAAAEERRLDPAISSAEAAEAQLDAEEWQLEGRRLARAVEQLRQAVERKEEADEADARKRRLEQAERRRDKLAEEVRERVPALFAELIDLFQRIQANDAELAGTGLDSAEVLARGVSGPFGLSTSPVQLARMKLPRFDGPGYCWPAEGGATMGALMEAEHRQIVVAREQRRPEVLAAELEAEDQRHALYHVEQERYQGSPVHGIAHRGGTTSIYNVDPDFGPGILEMNEDQVRAARAKGIRCTPAPAELRRFRVSNPRPFMGTAPSIATATGRVGVPNRQVLSVVMTAAQAKAATEADMIVEPVDPEPQRLEAAA